MSLGVKTRKGLDIWDTDEIKKILRNEVWYLICGEVSEDAAHLLAVENTTVLIKIP